MSDGHWNCWIFTNGGKESRFSTEVIHSLVVHAIMTVRISIVLKNTVIFTFRGVPLLYCYNCQFQHSQYCFAINEKITRVIRFMFMSKRVYMVWNISLCQNFILWAFSFQCEALLLHTAEPRMSLGWMSNLAWEYTFLLFAF